jgi:putative GTP pyrophosphokinase
MSDLDQNKFLQSYSLDINALTQAGIQWDQLVDIYQDHRKNFANLETAAKFISDSLRQVKEVHSLKFRVKDPEHLLEKIIRKKLEDNSMYIAPENYGETITDLIGVRALHLFKKDWMPIHEFITSNWELKETPTANIRKGDSDEMTKQFTDYGCVIKEHPFGYRSVHYLVESQPTKSRVVAEVQVRTIFEEGWSEIDHRMRYPYNLNNVIISAFLNLFNRLSGSADEMGSFINLLKDELDARDEQHNATVNELTDKIKKLEIDASKKKDLQRGVDRLSGLGAFSSAVDNALRAMVISPTFLETMKAAEERAQAAGQAALAGLIAPTIKVPDLKEIKRKSGTVPDKEREQQAEPKQKLADDRVEKKPAKNVSNKPGRKK